MNTISIQTVLQSCHLFYHNLSIKVENCHLYAISRILLLLRKRTRKDVVTIGQTIRNNKKKVHPYITPGYLRADCSTL
jgi:hypothetical protein